MEEIIDRLNENRQIELAKSILESNGYKVSKDIRNNRVYEAADPEFIHKVARELNSYLADNLLAEYRSSTTRDGSQEIAVYSGQNSKRVPIPGARYNTQVHLKGGIDSVAYYYLYSPRNEEGSYKIVSSEGTTSNVSTVEDVANFIMDTFDEEKRQY